MFDPMDEVRYGYRLAVNYLRETNDAFNRDDRRGTVATPGFQQKTRQRL